MRAEGVEPSRANAHGILSPARLPIPPRPLRTINNVIFELLFATRAVFACNLEDGIFNFV